MALALVLGSNPAPQDLSVERAAVPARRRLCSMEVSTWPAPVQLVLELEPLFRVLDSVHRAGVLERFG